MCAAATDGGDGSDAVKVLNQGAFHAKTYTEGTLSPKLLYPGILGEKLLKI